jgi:hypothetical protein
MSVDNLLPRSEAAHFTGCSMAGAVATAGIGGVWIATITKTDRAVKTITPETNVFTMS